MTTILDYRTTLYSFKGKEYSIGEFFHSAEWVKYLKSGDGPMPVIEGVALLIRLANLNNLPIDVSLFTEIICGNGDEGKQYQNLLNDWKKTIADELDRAQCVSVILGKKGLFPNIIYPLLNPNYSSRQKAHQLLATIDVWGNDRMKRTFFMLVFKFSRRSSRSKGETIDPSKWGKLRNDPNVLIYEQASNGLWDYIEHVQQTSTVRTCRRKKRQRKENVYTYERLIFEWIDWMGKQNHKFDLFLEYHRAQGSRRSEKPRLSLLNEFLWIYLWDGDEHNSHKVLKIRAKCS